MKSLKDEDLAQDIVQDCFEKLWKKKEDVQFEKVKSYLFTCAYHGMVDFWRKQKNKQDIEEVADEIGYTPSSYNGIKPILEKALNKLPAIQKTVLLLRDYEGYSYEEIGEICELNPSQVKVYIYRARISVKSCLGDLKMLIG